MRHWSEKYLQMTYDKWNCSQFVEYVLRDHFGRDYKFPQSKGNVFEQSNQLKESIPHFAKRTEEPQTGDLILMNGIRRLCHVGLLIIIGGHKFVLHTEARLKTARLQDLASLPYHGYTVEGFYRWLR